MKGTMLIFYWLLLLLVTPSTAVPSGFVDEGIADLDATKAAFVPNPRSSGKPMLLLSAKTGQIHVLENPDTSSVSFQIADMSSLLCVNGPHGLYSILPDPNFATNRYIYMYYTRYVLNCPDDPVLGPRNRVSRFTMNPTTLQIDLNSEVLYFETLPSPEFNHDGGAMVIGNDNFLYVAIGDGGANQLSQDRRNLYGKLLRFNLDGSVPASNPFTVASGQQGVPCRSGKPADSAPATAICEEIWAVGLRNPFRFGLDMNSAQVRFLISDVGGSFWEEISYSGDAYKGANYGWTTYEGPCRKDSTSNCPLHGATFTEPFYYYPHSTGGAAVTVAVFVPNGLWPSQYKMLYTDYVDGKLYNLVEDQGRACRACQPPVPAFRNDFFHQANSVVDMIFGPYMSTQALYYVQRTSSGQKIRRVRYTGSTNRAPNALITIPKTQFALSEVIPFKGDGSSDPDGDALTYLWNFGDGRTSTLVNPSISYSVNGQYQVTLTVTDSVGQTDQDQISIVIGNSPPSVVMNTPLAKNGFFVGQKLKLKGTAKDSIGNVIPASQMFWTVQIKHDTHFHPFMEETAGNNFDLFPAPKPEDLFAATNSLLVVSLTAFDQFGVSNTTKRNILPKKVNIDIATIPSGLKVVVDDTEVTTPITITSWQAHNLTLLVNDQGTNQFSSWSIGGGRSTSYIVPAATTPNPKITATFVDAPLAVPVAAPTFAPLLAPVEAPTLAPIPAPVEAPALAPLPAPVELPTSAPLPAPVEAPALAPLPAPVEAPNSAPLPAPVEAPTLAPVPAPVEVPTSAPLPVPVEAPTLAPLPAPVEAPALAPLPAPVEAPNSAPLPAPVEAPTLAPLQAPVEVPSLAPAPVAPVPVTVPVAPVPLTVPVAPVPSLVRINEFHYANSGADTGEFVEIACPAVTPVGTFAVWLYDGLSGRTYSKRVLLSSVTPTTVAGINYYRVVFPNVMQNDMEGIALVDGSNQTISFLSYEGTFVATNGPAIGLTSVDVGVREGGNPVGTSLQVCPDTGAWSGPKDDTPGQPNANCAV